MRVTAEGREKLIYGIGCQDFHMKEEFVILLTVEEGVRGYGRYPRVPYLYFMQERTDVPQPAGLYTFHK